jgi:hypothetical protein
MSKTKTVFFSYLACFFLATSLFAETLPPLPKGPLLLTSVEPAQLDPNFWINRLPEPDKVLKKPEEMDYFNEELHDMVAQRVKVTKIETSISGRPIANEISENFKVLRNRKFWGEDDQLITKSFFDESIEPRINLKGVPKTIKVRWGVVVESASVRALPTDTVMVEAIGDFEFDQLQYTRIKTWTPVAIYHQAPGSDWFFVQSPYSRGWVRSKDIATFGSKAELISALPAKNPLVVTGESVNVFYDRALTNKRDRVSMGTRFPYKGLANGVHEVAIPFRRPDGTALLQTAYISVQDDVTIGFKPYTQRNLITQAFKLLSARYGWGGQYYGRDCSGFTHDVFLSLGVDLPRNSKDQGFVGTQLGNFTPFFDADKKIEALRAARPGLTLILMRKHIMLYLGEYNGHMYVIHSTWAERISKNSDEKNRINQVVVSDLSLNGNSYLGSLFDRVIAVNEIY